MKDGHDGRIKVRHQDLDSLVRLAAHCLTNISDHQYDDDDDDDDDDFDNDICHAVITTTTTTTTTTMMMMLMLSYLSRGLSV